MGAPKPCLGFPSRTAAIHALRGQRLSTVEIASRIGIEPKTVVALEVGASRPRRRRPHRPHEDMVRTVLFPVDVLDQLGPHAAKRGIHPNHLARLIVSTVVDESMIDAVLDDADDLKAWAE